jgi:hypothetical protein
MSALLLGIAAISAANAQEDPLQHADQLLKQRDPSTESLPYF